MAKGFAEIFRNAPGARIAFNLMFKDVKDMKKEIKSLWNMINSILDNPDKTMQNLKNELWTIVLFIIVTVIFGYMSLFYDDEESILIRIAMGYIAILSFLLALLSSFICIFQRNCDKNNIFILKYIIKCEWRVVSTIILPIYAMILIFTNILKLVNLSNIGNSIYNLVLSCQVLAIWMLFSIILLVPFNSICKCAYYIIFFLFYFIAKLLEILATSFQCKNRYYRMKFIGDINKVKALFFAVFAFLRVVTGDLTFGFTFVILISYLYNVLRQLNHFDRQSKYKDFLLETLLKLEQYNNIIITAENNIEDENFFRYITSFKKLYTYMNSVYPEAVKEICLGEIKMYNIENYSKKKSDICTAMKSIESLVLLNETNLKTIKANITETQNLICKCFKIRMYF